MQQKRKISVRKILQFALSLVITAGCIVGIMSASSIENEKTVRVVDIKIENGDKYHFLEKQQVADMVINNRHIDILHTPVRKVDIQSMERIMLANPWVAKTQVYIDNGRALHLNITQRVPVARIFEEGGNSYYVDTTLSAMPLSSSYVHYAQVVTNVPQLKDDSASMSVKGQIVALVRFIESSKFWNAQVSQITMRPDNTFELVPVLGKQQILIGDTSRMAEKFDNLFRFYTKVLNNIGWDKYDVLDLRFKGQVVASPSLPWKAPVDKAMSNMSWVKSIIDNAAGAPTASSDTLQTAQAAMPKPAPQAVPPSPPKPKPAAPPEKKKQEKKQEKKAAEKQKEKKKQANNTKQNKKDPAKKKEKH